MTMSVKVGVISTSVEYPARLVSEANNRDYKRMKWARAKKQRNIAALRTKSIIGLPAVLAQPGKITITLTRLIGKGGRVFDDDNLTSAFKAIRDGVADALGIDDGSKRLVWEYGQERAAEFGVRIAIAAGKPDEKGN